MGSPRLTEALIARAIAAAKREGCSVVEIRDGAIRILVDASPADIPSGQAEDGGDAWGDEFERRLCG